jgi:ABC-type protease/lipase transport system fused ATPase/permease subunit
MNSSSWEQIVRPSSGSSTFDEARLSSWGLLHKRYSAGSYLPQEIQIFAFGVSGRGV